MSDQVIKAGAQIGASPEAIISHYDMGEEFFRLVLGPELIYSCALFADGDDLPAAQRRKLDHHIEAAGAVGAASVLDVGCGWGALLTRLVEHAGVKHAVGLTLSPSQAESIRRAARPGVEVREEGWRDHRPGRRYDAIVSVGAMEHFVHPGMPSGEKLKAYRDFFEFCDRVLVTHGRLSLQTIAFVAPVKDFDPVIYEKTFPESELPLVWEPIAAAEGRFELVSLRNDGEHYYRTLRLWERNLMAHYDEAVRLVGKARVAEFRVYLRNSAAYFKRKVVCLLRMTFAKLN